MPNSIKARLTAMENLKNVLEQLVEGLGDPSNHYFLSAVYYQQEDGKRVYIASMYLHQDSAWNLQLEADALALDVLLHRQEPDRPTRISIPYEVIYQVQRNHTGGLYTDEDTIYSSAQALSKLKWPPQESPPDRTKMVGNSRNCLPEPQAVSAWITSAWITSAWITNHCSRILE